MTDEPGPDPAEPAAQVVFPLFEMPPVLFEDAHCLAVSKPAGLLTQGPAGRQSLVDLVRAYLRPDDPSAAYLGTVHRLDKPVSGVILWAKTPMAARRLASQFEARRVVKEYWAIAEGESKDSFGVWEDWLGPPDPNNIAHVLAEGEPGARRAITRFERAMGPRPGNGLTRLVLKPETGRSHQLRVQCSSHGLPIMGDVAYGSTRTLPGRIALHARSLTVEHPILRRPLTILAPAPQYWAG
ncbi:RluA family pseudouridine synthase [Isosphaeraceae bacterium EP7]